MYRQAQLKEDLPHTHREKVIIEVYGSLRKQTYFRLSLVPPKIIICGGTSDRRKYVCVRRLSLWRRNEIVRADLNKKKYVVYVAMCSAADTVSGVLLEEARRDIKMFLPLFIYRALHLRRVWVDITACKLTTTCVRHWSQKIYNFPIVSVRFCATLQHLLSEKTSNRPLYVAYFS